MELAQEYYQEGDYTIETDKQAEEYLRKLSEETAETQRLVNVCDTAISEYEFKKRCYQEALEKKTAFMKNQLHNYFMLVNRKKTKTEESYELPSGKLKLKYSTPEYIRDEKTLVTWLEENKKDDFIKLKKSPDWESLKKTVTISGRNVVDADGLIVGGIVVENKPEKFEIEL